MVELSFLLDNLFLDTFFLGVAVLLISTLGSWIVYKGNIRDNIKAWRLVLTGKGKDFDLNGTGINGNSNKSIVFEIKIPRERFNRLDKFIQFQMVIRYANIEWDVWRRYSEFLAFKKRHEDEDSFKNSNCFFPSKSSMYDILSGREHTIEFVDERRQALQTFMKSVLPSKEEFERICAIGAEIIPFAIEERDHFELNLSHLGPSGRFFAVPKQVIQLFDKNLLKAEEENGVSKALIIEKAVKSFEIFMEHLAFIDKPPPEEEQVDHPWEKLSSSKDGKVKTFSWVDGNHTHIASKVLLDCKPKDLLELLLDPSWRHLYDTTSESQVILEKFLLQPPKGTFDKLEISEVFQEYEKIHPAEKEHLHRTISDVETRFGFRMLYAATQYIAIKSPAPLLVAKRDAVTVVVLAQHVQDKRIILCTSSIDKPPIGYKIPSDLATAAKSYVRADFICNATLFKETSDGNAQLVTLTMIDAGAYVPPRIMKSLAPEKAAEAPGMAPIARKRAQEKQPSITLLLE